MVKVSIIIPVKEINKNILKFVPKVLEQTFRDFEIIILPDKKSNIRFAKTRIIPTGEKGPAEKRDLGVKKSFGQIIAFIDDDAYPEKKWLQNALKIIEKEKADIVGGPNLAPPESNLFQKISGEVLSSWMVSGPYYYRYVRAKQKESDDLPSCNLIIKKEVFNRIGGFDTSFWPGEDTKLCLDAKKIGCKIVYSPEVLVFHERRPTLKSYLHQIGTYAQHRGFFAKNYPETSNRISYYVPSIFLIGLIGGPIISAISNTFALIYLSILFLYFVLVVIEAVRVSKISHYPYFMLLVFVTHINYGLNFIVGLIRKNLKSKYR